MSVEYHHNGHEKWLFLRKGKKVRKEKEKRNKKGKKVLSIPCQELQSSYMLYGDFHDQRVHPSLFLLPSQSQALLQD